MGNIIGWLLEKTNGYKSIIGYGVSAVSRFVEQKYPGAPAAEIATVLQWVGESLLIWGLSHKAVKVSKEKKATKNKNP